MRYPLRVHSFKCTDEDWDYWKNQARRERVSVSEWIRQMLGSGRVDGLTQEKVVIVRPVKPPKPKKVVVGVPACEHRLPVGAWCKRCRVLKK